MVWLPRSLTTSSRPAGSLRPRYKRNGRTGSPVSLALYAAGLRFPVSLWAGRRRPHYGAGVGTGVGGGLSVVVKALFVLSDSRIAPFGSTVAMISVSVVTRNVLVSKAIV